jgi:hypothetical protein
MDLIESIKDQVRAGDYRFTVHGFERCTERGISPNEIEDVILIGEIIEVTQRISTDRVVLSGVEPGTDCYCTYNVQSIQYGLLQPMIRH